MNPVIPEQTNHPPCLVADASIGAYAKRGTGVAGRFSASASAQLFGYRTSLSYEYRVVNEGAGTLTESKLVLGTTQISAARALPDSTAGCGQLDASGRIRVGAPAWLQRA